MHVAFERRFRIFTVHRERLVWDTRFLPPSVRLSSDRFYVLLEGRLDLFDDETRTYERPTAFRVRARDDSPEGTRVDHRGSGDVFRILEMHVTPTQPETRADREQWTPLDVPLEVLTECDAYERAARAGTLTTTQRDALLDRFVEIGWLSADARASLVHDEPPRTLRTWRAIAALFGDLRVSPALVELADAAEVSLRQAERDFTDLFATFASDTAGWRAMTRRFRLALAVLMLSAETSTVTNVARQVGYSRPEAMTTAFRAEGLPTPREVQRRLRDEH